MDNTLSVFFFVSAVLVFGGLIFIIISLTKSGPKALNQDKYRCSWLAIENRLKRDDENTYALCILEADKLLDQALRERGLSGKTMAERMKQLQGKWSNGNGIWAAHKVRNKIVHETNTKLEYTRVRQVLIAYKQGLKDVGAI